MIGSAALDNADETARGLAGGGRRAHTLQRDAARPAEKSDAVLIEILSRSAAIFETGNLARSKAGGYSAWKMHDMNNSDPK